MLGQGHVLNGRYRIERILGQGGMGAVYLALQRDLADWVAIKEMDIRQMEPELRTAWVHQFHSEARILNRLRHAGLPRVYDYFEQEDSHFLVMDFIEGGTLWNLLAHGSPTETQVIQWARELCDVLDYLHHHNPPVIFKDLKPNNVMLARDGSLRLIDFGIAKLVEAEGTVDTRTVLKGSVSDGYSPIEQYGQAQTDIRADIYALGATLYSLLTRKIPPPAPDRANDPDPLMPLAQLRPDVSERTANAIEWMMQVSRNARPRSIADIVDALSLTPSMPRTSTPARIRRLLREEFHHFFPSPTWVPRPGLPLDRFTSFLTKSGEDRVPAPLLGMWGAPGAGKSRVIHEVRTALKARFDTVPIVLGNRLLRHQPFGCLLPAVRLLLRRDSGALLTRLSSQLEAQVMDEAAAALPELKTVIPSGFYKRRSSAEMTRSLLTTLLAIFSAAVQDQSALLVIDDAQWADLATMRFLDQLRSSAAGQRIAMLLAWHPDAKEEPHRGFMESWSKDGQTAIVPIPPLDMADIKTYLEQTLPPIADVSQHLKTLHDLSGGNPLLLEEQIRLMVLRRVLRDTNGTLRIENWRPERMPRALSETVRRRLEHLPLDSQEILGQASVNGLSFSLETLRELSGEPEPVLREALQRAREAAFIRLSPDVANTYEFICEAARQVFYESLHDDERARLHRTLGILEEDRGAVTGEVTYSELHYSLAGDLDQSIENLQRLTQTFLSPKSIEVVLGEMPRIKQWDSTQELTADQEQKTLNALNMLMRAVRSKGSFGAAYVADMAQESLANSLIPLLEEVGPLSVTCAETIFTVNSKTLQPNQAPADLATALAKQRLSGFQCRPGLTRAELAKFTDLLVKNRESLQEGGGWTKQLEQHDIQNVTVSELVYVGVGETELFDASKLKDFTSVHLRDGRSAPPRPVDNDLGRVTKLLEGVEREHLDEQAILSRLDGIRKVLEEIRKQSILHGTADIVGPRPEAPAAAPAAAPAPAEAPTPEPEKPAPEPAPEVPAGPTTPPEMLALAKELLEQAHPQEVARLLSLVRSLELPLADYLQRNPEVLLQELEDPDPNRQAAATAALTAMGKRGVPAILRFLGHSDHPRARSAAAFVLKKVANDFDTLLRRRIVESGSPDENIKLLTVMQHAGLAWHETLNVLLHSASPEVRKQAFDFFQRCALPKAEKAFTLADIMKEDHPGPVVDALRTAGSLRIAAMIPTISWVSRRTLDKPADTVLVQREACYALGRIGEAQVLPLLKSIAFPSLTERVVSGKDPEVRSAALWAIGRIPGVEADDLLEKGNMDKDPLVRAVAKVAIETRNTTTTDPEIMAQMES